MEIKVVREKFNTNHTCLTGGEYATCQLKVFIDAHLGEQEQVDRLIHACTENYFPGLSHEKVDEFTEIVLNGIDQLVRRRC